MRLGSSFQLGRIQSRTGHTANQDKNRTQVPLLTITASPGGGLFWGEINFELVPHPFPQTGLFSNPCCCLRYSTQKLKSRNEGWRKSKKGQHRRQGDRRVACHTQRRPAQPCVLYITPIRIIIIVAPKLHLNSGYQPPHPISALSTHYPIPDLKFINVISSSQAAGPICCEYILQL